MNRYLLLGLRRHKGVIDNIKFKNMKEKIPVLYKNENEVWDVNMDVYNSADLIVQTTDSCNKNCPDCYLTKNNIIKNNLSDIKYKDSISDLKEGQIIALRGGETTMIKDWFKKFITPALDKKLKVILETNGYFIGKEGYKDILNEIARDDIFIRISFDPMHVMADDKDEEFKKMALFAKDAEENKINYGFYSLNLNQEQIMNFIKNTPLEPYIEKFRPLIKYNNISEVKISGKYLKANGEIFDRING